MHKFTFLKPPKSGDRPGKTSTAPATAPSVSAPKHVNKSTKKRPNNANNDAQTSQSSEVIISKCKQRGGVEFIEVIYTVYSSVDLRKIYFIIAPQYRLMKCLFQGEPPAKQKKPPVERNFSYDWRYTYDEKTHKKMLTRDWLQYKDGKMYCEVCVEFKDQIMKTGPANKNLSSTYQFIFGSTNFKRSAVDTHAISNCHDEAIALKKAVKDPEKTNSGRALKMLQNKELDHVKILFRNAQAVARHNLPFTVFPVLCKLDKAKGLDIGQTYNNEKACGDFIDAIGQTCQESLLNELKEASWYSMTMDGTTDEGGVEQESVFIRAVEKGIIKNHFFSMNEPTNTEAESLKEVLNEAKTTIEKAAPDLKLSGVTSDGAANMQGVNHGRLSISS